MYGDGSFTALKTSMRIISYNNLAKPVNTDDLLLSLRPINLVKVIEMDRKKIIYSHGS